MLLLAGRYACWSCYRRSVWYRTELKWVLDIMNVSLLASPVKGSTFTIIIWYDWWERATLLDNRISLFPNYFFGKQAFELRTRARKIKQGEVEIPWVRPLPHPHIKYACCSITERRVKFALWTGKECSWKASLRNSRSLYGPSFRTCRAETDQRLSP